ncbi:MAG: hypothetical protein ABR540_03220 [Acidimicrobiales bacterium]
MTVLLLGVLLALCFGVLIGSAWTTEVLGGRFRHHAAERRRLNEEWAALRRLRAELRRCPRCDDVLGPPQLVSAAEDDD